MKTNDNLDLYVKNHICFIPLQMQLNNLYICAKLIYIIKKTCALATLLLTSLPILSQEKLEQTGKVSLGMQGIEISYEQPIANTFIWESALGLGVGMNAINNESQFSLNIPNASPFLATGIKWMYNYEKRLAKKKNTINNAANYLGLQTKYSFGNNNSVEFQNQALLTDIHWGLQRTLSSKFTINTNIGLGYLQDFEFDQGTIAPVLRIKFGYRLF